MVKIRGYRVEPGTVEAAFLHDSRVRQAAVVVRQSSGCEPYLVAYVVLEARTAATVGSVVGAVANRLPAYAVPSALVIVESLPITRNGKTDYRALTGSGDRRAANIATGLRATARPPPYSKSGPRFLAARTSVPTTVFSSVVVIPSTPSDCN